MVGTREKVDAEGIFKIPCYQDANDENHGEEEDRQYGFGVEGIVVYRFINAVFVAASSSFHQRTEIIYPGHSFQGNGLTV